VCVQLLRYAEAKAAYDTHDKELLKGWRGNRMMKLVEEYEADLARREIEADESEE
jgi:hypothetical protein